MNEEQCTVASIDRSDRGSYAGQPTSIDAFLVLGECARLSDSKDMSHCVFLLAAMSEMSSVFPVL